MAQAAVGDGPISFFTEEGRHVSIPLDTITFDGDDVTTTATDPPDAASAWLKYLVKQGRLARAPSPPAGDAMIVTATAAGVAGDRITVAVESNGGATAEVTVTSIDRYEGLTLPTLTLFLGSSTQPGSKPGLVRVKAVGAAPPIDLARAPGTPGTAEVPGVGGAPATPATAPSWEIAPGTFVETWRTDADPSPVTIAISQVDVAGPGKFTLTAKWTKTVPNVAVTTAIADLAAAFAFIVDIRLPPGVPTFKLPADGEVQLRGGAAPVPAKKATATLAARA